MIDKTPTKLRRRIKEACDLRKKSTQRSKPLKDEYHCFQESNEQSPLNHPFEWNANVIGALAYSNPNIRVTEMGFEDHETQATEIAMRNLVMRHDYGFATIARRWAIDCQFDFAVGFVSQEPTPDYAGASDIVPMWPRIRRVPPVLYFRDARTPERGGSPEFEGHMWIKPYRMLLEARNADGSPKYDEVALSALQKEEGLVELRRDMMQEGIHLDLDDELIVGYEVFFHETQSWVTVGFAGEEAHFLRPEGERPYSGPTGGPYHMWGIFESDDQVYPVPPLVVTAALAADINRHRKQISEDAGCAKRLIVVNAASQGIIGNIQGAASNSILSIPGFNGMVSQVDLGGPTKESYEYSAFTTEKLDRLSGLTEIARGNVDGAATATAVAQAGAFTDARLRYMQSVFTEGCEVILSKAADLCMSSADIAFPIVIQDEVSGGAIRGTFYGGQIDPVGATVWRRNVYCKIEPFSMGYTNQQQQRDSMIQAIDTGIAVINAATLNPAIKPGPILDTLYDTLNVPDASRKFFDIDMLAVQQQMTQQSMLMGMAPPAPGAPPGKGKEPPAPPGQPASRPGGLVQGMPSPVG